MTDGLIKSRLLLCCFHSNARLSAAATAGEARGIPRDVTAARQGEPRDVIVIEVKFKVDIRLRRASGGDLVQQAATSPGRSVAALPCDARRPIAVIALSSRDLVIAGRHVCRCDVTACRRSSDTGNRSNHL